MPRPRSTQELIHWLEMGAGARMIVTAAALLGIFALSVLVAWKQFHGATSESALVQADVGRQLAWSTRSQIEPQEGQSGDQQHGEHGNQKGYGPLHDRSGHTMPEASLFITVQSGRKRHGESIDSRAEDSQHRRQERQTVKERCGDHQHSGQTHGG